MSNNPNQYGQSQPYPPQNYQTQPYGTNAMHGKGSDSDREHLQLLSVFQYVFAGITALFSLFPLIHLTLGIVMLTGGMGNDGPPAELGWFFIAIAATAIAFGMAMAVAMFFAGNNLRLQTNRTYCLIIAAFQCLMMPLGTILGIFTIIVLLRPSVIAKFQSNGG